MRVSQAKPPIITPMNGIMAHSRIPEARNTTHVNRMPPTCGGIVATDQYAPLPVGNLVAHLLVQPVQSWISISPPPGLQQPIFVAIDFLMLLAVFPLFPGPTHRGIEGPSMDSCIIVKLLSPEPDSALFSKYCAGQVVHTSELAITEVFGALVAKERARKIPAALRSRAFERFEALVMRGAFEIIPVNRLALRKADHVLQQCHPDIALRTLDAIHLASADLCQQFPLVTTDQRMRDAALKLSMTVFPSEPPEE